MIISIEREHDICKYFPFIYTLQKKDTEDLISSIYWYIYTNQSALGHNNDFLLWPKNSWYEYNAILMVLK